jgi:hypothetical protein
MVSLSLPNHFCSDQQTKKLTPNPLKHTYSITPLLSSIFLCSPAITFPSLPIAALLILAGFSTPLKVLLNHPETRPGGPLPAISV